jgi:hypothetical protein
MHFHEGRKIEQERLFGSRHDHLRAFTADTVDRECDQTFERIQSRHKQILATFHFSGPAVIGDPAVDITDFYAFPSPDRPENLVLIMNVFPLARSAQRVRERHQVGVGLEAPHAGELLDLVLAARGHDEPRVPQTPRADGGVRSGLFSRIVAFASYRKPRLSV